MIKTELTFFSVLTLFAIGCGFFLDHGWSTKTMQQVTEHCEKYDLTNRREALKISSEDYDLSVRTQFIEQDPAQYLNDLHSKKAGNQKISCDIGNQLLAKHESNSVIEPSSNVCSPVAYSRPNEKTGKLEDASPCETITTPP